MLFRSELLVYLRMQSGTQMPTSKVMVGPLKTQANLQRTQLLESTGNGDFAISQRVGPANHNTLPGNGGMKLTSLH